MGVHIPNMEMPKSCWGCELLSSCKAMPNNPTAEEIGIYTVMRLKDCPLIEIVECKDCKYWADDMSGNMWCEHAIGRLTEATDFCSYGERRSDPNNCKECEIANKCDHHICLKAIRERRTDE